MAAAWLGKLLTCLLYLCHYPFDMADVVTATSLSMSRSLRRALVATSVGAVAIGVVAMDLGNRTGLHDLGFAAGVVAFGIAIAAAVAIWRWSRNRARWRDVGLDERDRQERDRAWAISYRILAGVVVGGPLSVILIGIAGGEGAAVVVTQILIASYAFIGLLPTLVLAWIELDLPAET